MIDYNHKLHDEFIQNILNTRDRFNVDGYKERHHIIPECCGGPTEEWNLIDLTAQEHYEAHKLLAKENPNNWELQTAWWNFCIRKASPNATEVFITADEYAEARERRSILMSEKFSGDSNPNYNSGTNHWTEKSKEKFRASCQELKIQGFYDDWNPRAWGAGMKKGYKMSDETKVNMSKAHKGKSLSESHRQHLSESLKSKGRNPRADWGAGRKKGYKESEETKKKKSIVTTGAGNPRAKAVRCIETNEIFDCIKYACESYSLNKHQIIDCCKGRKETAGGYHWEYVNNK